MSMDKALEWLQARQHECELYQGSSLDRLGFSMLSGANCIVAGNSKQRARIMRNVLQRNKYARAIAAQIVPKYQCIYAFRVSARYSFLWYSQLGNVNLLMSDRLVIDHMTHIKSNVSHIYAYTRSSYIGMIASSLRGYIVFVK
jgi:hypothetical protein